MATFNELKLYNPRLFWDGVCRKSIPYSAGEGLDPGGVVTNAFAEGFVGGPFAPINALFDPNGSIPIGGGTNIQNLGEVMHKKIVIQHIVLMLDLLPD